MPRSRPYLEHAYDLCVKGRADAREGIYQLIDDAGTISSEAFSAEALAKIVYDEAAAELCVVWNTCHPKYETHPPPLGISGYVTACFIEEAIGVANTGLHARSLRIYMQNAVNRDWAAVFAAIPDNDALAVVGNWIYVADVTEAVALPKFHRWS